MTPGDHDWLKTLVSTLAGLFAGLIAEPFKDTIQTMIVRRKIRKSVYVDIVLMFNRLLAVQSGKFPAAEFWADLELPTYLYHWEKDRDYFFTTSYLQSVRLKHLQIVALRQEVKEGGKPEPMAVKELENILVGLLGEKEAGFYREMEGRWRPF